MQKANNTDVTEIFRSAPIPKAVFKNTIPAMLAMLMVLIYNLADTFFIAMTKNDLMVAAVALTSPVFLLFMAVGNIFGIGGTSVISRALGENRSDYAKKVCSFCMWACVACGIVMTVLIFAFADPILRLVGASADTWLYAKQYLLICSAAGPFVLVANCYSNIIRAEGRSEAAMAGQLIGNLLNVILDPILILVCHWDVVGAALATALSNVISALIYVGYFKFGKSILSIRLKDCSCKNDIVPAVLAIGIPASLANILMSVSNMVINSQMASYDDMAVAGIGVSIKVSMIISLICIGLGQGIQPMLGYCIGAKDRERYKKALWFTLIFALILGVVLELFCYVMLEAIVGAFLTDKASFTYAVTFSKIMLTTNFLVRRLLCAEQRPSGHGGGKGGICGQCQPPGTDLYPGTVRSGSTVGYQRSCLDAAGGRCTVTDSGDRALCACHQEEYHKNGIICRIPT